MENNKKKIIFLVLTIVMCLGVSLGAIYFIYHKKDTRDNEITSGLISIDFKEGIILIWLMLFLLLMMLV